MSLAALAASEGAIAEINHAKQSSKPPPKRTIVAVADAVTVSEAR